MNFCTCLIYPLSLLSGSQETFSARYSFFSFRSGRSKSQSCPARAGLPLTLSKNYSPLSFKTCQSRIWMLISKARNGFPNLPLLMQLFFRYVLSNSCVSGTLQDTGDALSGSKERDRSNVPLSFLELCLINKNSNDDNKDDDNIIKTINLCSAYYVLPGTALNLRH